MNVSASLPEGIGDGGTDAAGAAGDEDGLVVKVVHIRRFSQRYHPTVVLSG